MSEREIEEELKSEENVLLPEFTTENNPGFSN
jgi:hypothetical protein